MLARMSTTTPSHGTYVVQSSAEEYDRLVRVAQGFDPDVQDGWRRAGLGVGARVIDVGCGPLGALLSFANLVGSNGCVVGLDFNPGALATAGTILSQHRLNNVQLVQGDISSIALDEIPGAGSFDLAYCRLFLIHQRDPVATLRRMSELVRPGGKVLVQEMVFGELAERSLSEPPLPARARWQRFLWSAMHHAGASPSVATRLGSVCVAAGLEDLGQRAFAAMSGPRNASESLALEMKTLQSVEKAVVDSGVATVEEVHALIAEYQAAQSLTFDYWVGHLCIELLARVPEARAA
jgi:ubiquinone/menaquinone biosynthesis C-methylase UbiE